MIEKPMTLLLCAESFRRIEGELVAQQIDPHRGVEQVHGA